HVTGVQTCALPIWPETIALGTNELIGTDPTQLLPALDRLFAGQWKKGGIPEKWDGKSGERIVAALERLLATRCLRKLSPATGTPCGGCGRDRFTGGCGSGC